eukprot:1150993-Rhodomonas_salina.1
MVYCLWFCTEVKGTVLRVAGTDAAVCCYQVALLLQAGADPQLASRWNVRPVHRCARPPVHTAHTAARAGNEELLVSRHYCQHRRCKQRHRLCTHTITAVVKDRIAFINVSIAFIDGSIASINASIASKNACKDRSGISVS